MENAVVRVPSLAEMEVVKLINGPEAFTPGRRVHPRPVRRARLLGRRRVLRPRARGRRGDGQARRRVDRRGHAVARRLAHGLAALRYRVPEPRVHARAHEGDLRDVLRRQVPGPRALGRDDRCASRRRTAGCRSSVPSSARSRAGSGRTGSSRTPRAGTSRCVRAAGREALVAGDRRRARRVPRGGGALRRDVVREARGAGEGAADVPRAACAQPRRARGRPGDVHADAQRAGGIECDFTVTRLAEDRFRIVTGTAFGQHDLAWLRQHAPDDGSVQVSDVTSRTRASASGGRSARDPAAAHDRRPLERGVPVHASAGARRRPRAVPRAACDVRRRARVGALLPLRVRARALGHDLGGGAASTVSSPAGTRRSTRCGSRRATACGAPTSRPRTRRSRPGSASP